MPARPGARAARLVAAGTARTARRGWSARALRWLGYCALALLLAGPATASGSAAGADTRTLLVLGDSLSAAYGMASEQGWVHLLAQRIAAEQDGWRVVNASMSGETTAGGASRIASELAAHDPDLVVLELGANDALRGLPLGEARANLQRIIDAARGHGASVLLLGMRIPPNYGRAYSEAFQGMYAALAAQDGVALLPFLLEPIALDRGAFLPDEVHPRPEVQDELMEHVWPALEPLLEADAAP